MLSGLKFIPREQVEKAKDESLDDPKKRNKSGFKKETERKKKKKYRSTSSDDDELERIRVQSKKKKWYTSDEDLSLYSDGSGSGSESGASEYERKVSSRKTSKKRRSKDRKSKERSQSSPSESESERKKKRKKDRRSESKDDELGDNLLDNDFGGSKSNNDHELVRKEMGLEWMLRPKDNVEKIPEPSSACAHEETPTEEATKVNPRELNPYLKDGGSGYPDDSEGTKASGSQLLSAGVGDGGASWRLKALKRAQEQADREGRKLDEVVAERWGSLSQLAVSVASRKAAPTRAHLRAIKDRRQGITEEEEAAAYTRRERFIRKEMSPGHSKMRMPNLKDSLSWRKGKDQNMSNADSGLIAAAISSVNKFSNDGSFMREFIHPKSLDTYGAHDSSNSKSGVLESRPDPPVSEKTSEDATSTKPALTANQLAAKVMQLRMKGMHDEADKLQKEAAEMKMKQAAADVSSRPQIDGSTSRYVMHDLSARQKKKQEDADVHLAQKIVQNKQYNIYGQADEEYDYDDGPRRKPRKKGGMENHKSIEIANRARRVLTQQERCQFCFENPTRPKHLVVAIANFTYLSLPMWQPVVPGHCCILTIQHESATRSLDDNVWEEIRNFKKCLIMMFAKLEKDLVFLETVMCLAQQRRHCLVECIPLSRDVAKQAPLYFKKAIDEAEDEWSQHNAKKLIDTSVKGLRASIPKDFPYFHVEFGLNNGFVHVIDDEKQFKSGFGLNVIRGMLKLPPEDMHQRRKRESVDTQREAVASFAREWEPFDWTRQLD